MLSLVCLLDQDGRARCMQDGFIILHSVCAMDLHSVVRHRVWSLTVHSLCLQISCMILAELPQAHQSCCGNGSTPPGCAAHSPCRAGASSPCARGVEAHTAAGLPVQSLCRASCCLPAGPGRTRLVGADGRRAAHGLRGGQVAHKVVVGQHALHAVGQRDGDCQGQALRDGHHLWATPASSLRCRPCPCAAHPRDQLHVTPACPWQHAFHAAGQEAGGGGGLSSWATLHAAVASAGPAARVHRMLQA